MRYRPALLQTTAAILWLTTIITAFTGYDHDLRTFSALDGRIWRIVAGAAMIVTLCALMQATVTMRIDRMFLAMFRATPRENPEPHGRHRLAVVPPQGRREHEPAERLG